MTLYSVTEVADILRIRVHAVRALIAQGHLPAVDISLTPGGRPRWRIESSELEGFIRRRTHAAAPKKRKNPSTNPQVKRYF